MDAITVPADLPTLVLRLALATLLGAAVGLNRELSSKPAGLRTHALVSLGAALLVLVGLALSRYGTGDVTSPARIIQGVVAGIGFIGGGVILHRLDAGAVQGLTTAASIWVVSAAGVAVGAGLWRAATISVAFALLVLIVGRMVDRAVHARNGDFQDD